MIQIASQTLQKMCIYKFVSYTGPHSCGHELLVDSEQCDEAKAKGVSSWCEEPKKKGVVPRIRSLDDLIQFLRPGFPRLAGPCPACVIKGCPDIELPTLMWRYSKR